MRAIFISYRRDDAEGQAGRRFHDLTKQFGDDAVFMDVAAIEPGRDFRRAIDEQVTSCGVLLALIGKNWLSATNQSGARRLDDPMDFVRLETASALKRDIPVVPVLVHGAGMPRAQDLPDDIKELSFRNGVELTHARWDSDVQVLVKALRPYVQAKLGLAAAPAANRAGLLWARPRLTLWVALASLVVLGVGAYMGSQTVAVPVGSAELERPIETRTAQAPDWEGSWDLVWEYDRQSFVKPMKLSADLLGITGDYEVGTLKGAFVDGDVSKVTGEIRNVTNTGVTCSSGQQSGRFYFELSSDGRSMKGWWSICDERTQHHWSAVKR
jgi:hypothetical protein